jgi:hypothetical protein
MLRTTALNGQCHLIRLGDSLNRFCERLFPSDPEYDDVGMSLFAPACFVLAPMAIIAARQAHWAESTLTTMGSAS